MKFKNEMAEDAYRELMAMNNDSVKALELELEAMNKKLSPGERLAARSIIETFKRDGLSAAIQQASDIDMSLMSLKASVGLAANAVNS